MAERNAKLGSSGIRRVNDLEPVSRSIPEESRLGEIVRGATGSSVAGSIAQYGIIVFAAFAALTQLNIAPELIAPTFLILLGAVALAAAIAFGLGAQGTAQQIVQGAYARKDEANQKIQQQRQQNQQRQNQQRSEPSNGEAQRGRVRRYEER